MLYRFTRNYTSSRGTWEQGATVEDAELIAWLQRDSPGCIEEVKPEPKRQQGGAQNRQKTAPGRTRQQKGGAS